MESRTNKQNLEKWSGNMCIFESGRRFYCVQFGRKQACTWHDGHDKNYPHDATVLVFQSYNTIIAVYDLKTQTVWESPDAYGFSRTTSKQYTEWQHYIGYGLGFPIFHAQKIVSRFCDLWRYNRAPNTVVYMKLLVSEMVNCND